MEPPPQGIEAAREAMAAMGGSPSSQGYGAVNEGCEDEDENENEGAEASEDGLRQVKAGQGGGESKIQSPRSEVGAETKDERDKRDIKDRDDRAGAKVQFLHEERRPCLGEPGYEILFTQDNTYGTRYRKVPIGWQDPEAVSPGEVQGPETGADEGRGIIGRGMKNGEAEARPAIDGNSQNGNTGLEAEARPANPVDFQAGRAALGLASGKPYVPDPDPEVEAYNRWWRRNRNFEPFDYEELQRIYAELPQKIAEYQAKLRREAGAGELLMAESMEGAGI